jgi:VCBS repeat-containing protein
MNQLFEVSMEATNKKQAKVWHKGLISQLEPRLMYDGAAVVAAVEVIAATDSDSAPDTHESVDTQNTPVATDQGPTDENDSTSSSTTVTTTEVVEALNSENSEKSDDGDNNQLLDLTIDQESSGENTTSPSTAELLDALETDPDSENDINSSATSFDEPIDENNPESEILASTATLDATDDTRTEIAFIDASVKDADVLVAGIDPSIDIYYLDKDSSGISQMAEILDGIEGVDAIHIFSHGSSGDVTLGSEHLTTGNMDSVSDELATIGGSMDENGDILLYGCNVGEDVDFINNLKELTGADVAASDDTTGSSELGGDWILEQSIGVIETNSLAIANYSAIMADPSIDSLNDTSYTEYGSAITIDSNVSISGGNSYTGGYIEFDLTNGTTADTLALITDGSASTTNNVVSIVGTTVYVGNGTSAVVIGSVDATYNGLNGQTLRVNFSNEFSNGEFDSGTAGSTIIDNWVVINDQVKFGTDTIAGLDTPTDTTWPTNSGGTPTDQNTPYSGYTMTTTLNQDSVGDLSVKMYSSMTTIAGYDIVRGPYIYSNGTVSLSAGDTVSFSWQAQGGGDAYDVYGYLVEVDTNNIVTILDETGSSYNASTSWATETVTLTTAGQYRFVFVSGTYDYTGGQAAGAQLFIDDVTVTQAVTPPSASDTILSDIARRVTYSNSSDDPGTSRNYSISVETETGTTDTSNCTINITQLNNAPSFTNNIGMSMAEDVDSSGSTISSLFSGVFSDPDSAISPYDTLGGIAITADLATSAQGDWEYSLNSGSSWNDIGTVSTTSALLLSADTLIRFNPEENYNGTPGALTVYAVDSTNSTFTTNAASPEVFNTTTDDGNSAVALSGVTLSINVSAVNDAPEITNGPDSASLTETDTTLTTSGSFTVTDVDTTDLVTASVGDSVGFSGELGDLTNAALKSMLTVTPTSILDGSTSSAVLTWDFNSGDEAFDYLAAGEILTLTYTVKAIDNNSSPLSQSTTVEITITGTNDVPIISGPDSTSVNEDNSISISGIEVSDVDSSTLTVNIDAAHGDLTLGTATGLTVTGAGTHALELSGTATAINAALATLSYTGDNNFYGDDPLSITVKDESSTEQPYRVDQDGKFYNPSNGHYYEFVTASGITWADAKTEAESRSLYGLNGYLVTVTSQDENDFITPKLGGDGWMGASDAETEGIWKWVTGPEAGTQFWTGDTAAGINSTGNLGSAFNGQYANWDSSEPNNSYPGYGEDYAHFYQSDGKWNDFYENFSSGIQGYVVEYGGDGFGGTTPTAALLTVTVSPVNDAPIIGTSDIIGSFTEGASISTIGAITFTDVDITDNPTGSESLTSLAGLRANGTTPLSFTTEQRQALEDGFSVTNPTGNTNNGTINWSYNISEANLDFLAAGETVTAIFSIEVADNEGGTDTQDVTITINGTNDAPVITAVNVVGNITEGTTLTDSGSITFTDVDLTDRPTATEITKSVTATQNNGSTPLALTTDQQDAIEAAFTISPATSNTNNGTINWDYTIDNTDLDFLADGEKVTAVFTIRVNDGNGSTIAQDVTININNSNDTPVITVVDVTGDITEGSVLTDNGSITFADLDLTDLPTATEATNTVTATLADNTTPLILTAGQQAAIEAAFSISADAGNNNNGSINWVYNISEANLNFLAEGETVMAVFTITADDNNGGTATQDVTVTIHGTNDIPTIGTSASGGFTEAVNGSNMVLSESGTVTFDDLDGTDVIDITYASNNDIAWSGGTIKGPLAAQLLAGFTTKATDAQAPGTTSWTYSSTGTNLDFLAKGETITFSYTVTATDNTGATATDTVAFTITGTNDTGVAGSLPSPQSSQAFQPFQYSIPASTFTDVDTNDSFSYSVSGLPQGLSFSTSNLQITGTPTEAGTFTIIVTAKDQSGATTQVSFSITIAPAPVTVMPSIPPIAGGIGDTPTPMPADIPSIDPGPEIPLTTDNGEVRSREASFGDDTGKNSALLDTILDGTNTWESGIQENGGYDTSFEDIGEQSSGDKPGEKQTDISREIVRVDSLGQLQFDEQSERNSAVSLSVESLQIDSDTQAFTLKLYIDSKSTVSNYTATLGDGAELPQWLKFDPITGTITGQPPAGIEKIELKIEVVNEEGDTEILLITVDFEVSTDLENIENDIENTTSSVIGLQPLSAQLEEMGRVADCYGDELLEALA